MSVDVRTAADEELVETVDDNDDTEAFVVVNELEIDELSDVTLKAIDDELFVIVVERVPIDELNEDDAVWYELLRLVATMAAEEEFDVTVLDKVSTEADVFVNRLFKLDVTAAAD